MAYERLSNALCFTHKRVLATGMYLQRPAYG